MVAQADFILTMMQRLTNSVLLQSAYTQIRTLIRAHAEWLYVSSDEVAQPIRKDELDIAIAHDRLMLSCWTEKGTRVWHVRAWQWTGQSLVLQVSRKMRAELALIELIPRVS